MCARAGPSCCRTGATLGCEAGRARGNKGPGTNITGRRSQGSGGRGAASMLPAGGGAPSGRGRGWPAPVGRAGGGEGGASAGAGRMSAPGAAGGGAGGPTRTQCANAAEAVARPPPKTTFCAMVAGRCCAPFAAGPSVGEASHGALALRRRVRRSSGSTLIKVPRTRCMACCARRCFATVRWARRGRTTERCWKGRGAKPPQCAIRRKGFCGNGQRREFFPSFPTVLNPDRWGPAPPARASLPFLISRGSVFLAFVLRAAQA